MKIDPQNPTEDFLKRIDVHELLPQKEPFVMISKLVHFDMSNTKTETLISEENIFVDNGYFSTSGLIENIAQTCAARIGSIRNLTILELPKVGDIISTTVEVIEDVFGMTLASARISLNGNTIVETEIKIAVKEEGDI